MEWSWPAPVRQPVCVLRAAEQEKWNFPSPEDCAFQMLGVELKDLPGVVFVLT